MTYAKEYYQENKERQLGYLKEKTRCDCGKILARGNLSRHRLTPLHANRMKHIAYINEKLGKCQKTEK